MPEKSASGKPAPSRLRVLAWLGWWAAMMALWVMVDDSLAFDELLAGAAAAALAATAADLVASQAELRLRPGPLRPLAAELLRLPGRVARDTVTVFAALARGGRRPPEGGYAEVPVPARSKVLLTGIRSVAPNSFVVGIDDRRGVMLVHYLVTPGGGR